MFWIFKTIKLDKKLNKLDYTGNELHASTILLIFGKIEECINK